MGPTRGGEGPHTGRRGGMEAVVWSEGRQRHPSAPVATSEATRWIDIGGEAVARPRGKPEEPEGVNPSRKKNKRMKERVKTKLSAGEEKEKRGKK